MKSNSKDKIIFLGTPQYAASHLSYLIDKGFNIVAVITQQDKRGGRGGKQLFEPPVKKLAQENGIKVYQPNNINSPEMVELIKSYSPSALVVIAYGQLLRRRILRLAKYGAVNVHPSLLPKLRGAAPLEWALAQGATETGVTTMRINLKMDAGKIYLQEKFKIGFNDTIRELYQKAIDVGAPLLAKTLNLIFAGEIEPVPQNDDEATYCPKITKEDGKVDFFIQSALDIWNRYRAFLIWPGLHCQFRGKRIKIIEVKGIDTQLNDESGKVVKISQNDVWISTLKGTIIISKFQQAGKKVVPAASLLNGLRIRVGDKWEN